MSNIKSYKINQNCLGRRQRGEKLLSLTRQDTSNKISEDSSEFSFSKGLIDSAKISIRTDLFKLPKEDIIEILLQQIEQSKILRIKLSTMQEQCKLVGSFRQSESDIIDETEQLVSIVKYKQLADYMEQYINNTNEAHNHFTNIINELKINNKKLKQQNSQLFGVLQKKQKKQQTQKKKQQQKQRIQQLQKIIGNLEDSLTHYMNINNQQTRKYDKLKRMYELLENQLQISLDQNQVASNFNQVLVQSKKGNIEIKEKDKDKDKNKQNQKQALQERLKILQIQNHELKQSWSVMEKTLQNKSQKIRKLLEQMEKLSQQKWIYKQKYMELKSKSFLYSQSSTKNSDFGSNAQSSTNIIDFNCEK